MWSVSLDRDVGDRAHRLIAALVATGEVAPDVVAAARALLADRPVSGARAASVRLRVAAAAGTYLRRFRPVGADLLGVEVPLGGGVADLMWAHGTRWVIDEVKTGGLALDDSRLVAQVGRLLAGGHADGRPGFEGVRLVPLASPGRAALAVAVTDRVKVVSLPAWLEVR